MTQIHIDRAGAVDARDMAELLNEIIKIGGTTAYQRQRSKDDMIEKMQSGGARSVWHVARDDRGTLLGFQWVAPMSDDHPEAAIIASFVRVGATGLGIGSKLFDATRTAAAKEGFDWIDATIRADNESGLTYYQSRGFETYKTDPTAQLSDGTIVGTISKRYDLK